MRGRIKLSRFVARAIRRLRRSAARSTHEIQACTINHGATRSRIGDPELRHCLVHIRGYDGYRRSLSISRRGLGLERHADVPSCRCAAPVPVTAYEVVRFERALLRCAAEGYVWGERDCCSCIEQAFVDALGRRAPRSIRSAAAALAATSDPLASDTDP